MTMGALIVEAERKAKRKAHGHTASAPCGCTATVVYFSATSYRLAPHRCPEHRTR